MESVLVPYHLLPLCDQQRSRESRLLGLAHRQTISKPLAPITGITSLQQSSKADLTGPYASAKTRAASFCWRLKPSLASVPRNRSMCASRRGPERGRALSPHDQARRKKAPHCCGADSLQTARSRIVVLTCRCLSGSRFAGFRWRCRICSASRSVFLLPLA